MLAAVRRIDAVRYRALHVAVQADTDTSITRLADALANRRKEQAMLNNPLAAPRLKEAADHPRTFEASATKALDTARVAAMGSAWGAIVGDDLQGVGEGAALFVAAHGLWQVSAVRNALRPPMNLAYKTEQAVKKHPLKALGAALVTSAVGAAALSAANNNR